MRNQNSRSQFADISDDAEKKSSRDIAKFNSNVKLK